MPDIYDIAMGFRAALLSRERAAAVRLVKAYGVAYKRIQGQLEKLLTEMAKKRAAGETIDPAWLFQQERYRALLNQVTTEVAKFADVANSAITEQQRQSVNAAIKNTRQLITSADAASISGSFNQVPFRAVENLVGFLGDGSPLNSLLGQLAPSARAKVESGLIEGISAGFGPRKIASRMKDALGGNLKRALTISRTETARAYREASHRTYQQNADVLQGWVWVAALSRRTCAACIALHGTIHPVTERMASHVNCRCVAIPALIGEPLPVERGVDWFADQPADTQAEILDSPEAVKAYRGGKLRLEDFVGRRDDMRWGSSYFQLGLARAQNGEGRFPTSNSLPIF